MVKLRRCSMVVSSFLGIFAIWKIQRSTTNLEKSKKSFYKVLAPENRYDNDHLAENIQYDTDGHAKIFDLGGSDWTVQSNNGSISIPAQVPGGIYSDLERAQVLNSSVYFRFNDVKFRWVGQESWVYKKEFTMPKSMKGSENVLLNLEGLDTVAEITLNEQFIGRTENMFVRYRFDVKEHIKFARKNTLEIAFESPVLYAKRKFEEHSNQFYIVPPIRVPEVYHGENHANFIRKTQASFGWDIGPSFPSTGIYKPISIQGYQSANIQYVTFNSMPEEDCWRVSTRVLVEAENGFEGQLDIEIVEKLTGHIIFNVNESVMFSLFPENEILDSFQINGSVPKKDVKTWWPNELGDQNLYILTATLRKDKSNVSSKSIQVGFRTIELVQKPLHDIYQTIAQKAGDTFFFKVNGVPIFAKGSNLVPIHILPEKVTKGDVDYLLKFAKTSHMNMIRVWGGGSYQSEYFHRKADELGILVWQDFMFACSMYPVNEDFLKNVQKEIFHQVRRLQHHPMIRNIVIQEAPDTPWMTSSPIGKHEIGHVNPSTNPMDLHYGDNHFYIRTKNQWQPGIYPIPRFMSEYGFQSFPSISTLEKFAYDDDLYFPSRFINHRQHGPKANDELVFTAAFHFHLDRIIHQRDPEGLAKLLYLAQVNQAESLRTETELLRRMVSVISEEGHGMTMGALYWQLNSIWPGGCLSTFEHGGKWKLANYAVEQMFRPVVVVLDVTSEERVKVHVVNDGGTLVSNFTLHIELQKYSDLHACFQQTIAIPPVAHLQSIEVLNVGLETILDQCSFPGKSETTTQTAKYPESAPLESLTVTTQSTSEPDYRRIFSLLTSKIFNSQSEIISQRTKLLSEPKEALGLINPRLSLHVERISNVIFEILISTESVALFVALDTPISGRFSDNGFHLLNASKSVIFHVDNGSDMSVEQFTKQLNVISYYNDF
ncbi:hypothetical protein TCAL_00176 [Tigriopus californicus]|uniref:beta-mannosidase n=1 Tax=Tigriopus californicus TaxID=6832 RepID=A0A553P2K4_TIGCA|nr:hypothetical protein TCAL_00176 [Tigriopus californicus]